MHALDAGALEVIASDLSVYVHIGLARMVGISLLLSSLTAVACAYCSTRRTKEIYFKRSASAPTRYGTLLGHRYDLEASDRAFYSWH